MREGALHRINEGRETCWGDRPEGKENERASEISPHDAFERLTGWNLITNSLIRFSKEIPVIATARAKVTGLSCTSEKHSHRNTIFVPSFSSKLVPGKKYWKQIGRRRWDETGGKNGFPAISKRAIGENGNMMKVSLSQVGKPTSNQTTQETFSNDTHSRMGGRTVAPASKIAGTLSLAWSSSYW